MNESTILPPDTLSGICVGVSVSESEDLSRLGLLEGHFRSAFGEIARSVLVLGGQLAYGGHLDPHGYTAFLVSELKRYGRRDRPLRVCLAWSEHRRVPMGRLRSWILDLGLFGTLVCLDVDGRPINSWMDRGEEPLPVADSVQVERGLTELRRHMCRATQGRVLIGGRRSGFRGAMPGLIEETLLAIEAAQPLYLAGGFGGVTLDIIRALHGDAALWFPPYEQATTVDTRSAVALGRLADLVADRGWKAIANGLSDEENSLLAATHRPSQIAALVSLGLGRLAVQGRFAG